MTHQDTTTARGKRNRLAQVAAQRLGLSLLALALTGALFWPHTKALAQAAGGDFALVKASVDGGGGRSSGGRFSLSGTIGQPEPALAPAVGGEYQLSGGFWAAGVDSPADEAVFLDGFES